MNIGVCGTGTIASWISDTICQMEDEKIVLYTCATSPGFECESFAKKYGYRKISASFEELMQDPEVDLVYIAVPNQFHYRLCKKAILYGKNLVCEKPFSVREDECRELLDLAKQKNVFFSEALWPAFLPAYRMIQEEIASGTIGMVTAGRIVMLDNVMFLDRVKHLETGGGVLLDEGPYALGCMAAFFGTEIQEVQSKTRKLESGVDAEEELTVIYRDGRRVWIHQAMDTPEDAHEQYVEILGSNGKIWMNAVANPTEVFIFNKENEKVKTLEIPEQIHFRGMPPVSGYEHEWQAFEKALREGQKECVQTRHETTGVISAIMSQVLENAGIVFPV